MALQYPILRLQSKEALDGRIPQRLQRDLDLLPRLIMFPLWLSSLFSVNTFYTLARRLLSNCIGLSGLEGFA